MIPVSGSVEGSARGEGMHLATNNVSNIRFSRILVGTDFSKLAAQALKMAARFWLYSHPAVPRGPIVVVKGEVFLLSFLLLGFGVNSEPGGCESHPFKPAVWIGNFLHRYDQCGQSYFNRTLVVKIRDERGLPCRPC